MATTLKAAGWIVEKRKNVLEKSTGPKGWGVFPATAALLAQGNGEKQWSLIDGIACTPEEAGVEMHAAAIEMQR